MTVDELIDALAKLPMDAPVLISGYEGGAQDIQAPVRLMATMNASEGGPGGIFGPHELQQPYQSDVRGMTEVVYLQGVTRDQGR